MRLELLEGSDRELDSPSGSEVTQGLRGLYTVSPSRWWHHYYAECFPDPIPRTRGHQPAVLQKGGVPLDLLLFKQDVSKFKPGTIVTPRELRQKSRDVSWAANRERWVAGGALAVHGINFMLHWMNGRYRYVDHMYAPRHKHIYTAIGKF